MKDDFFTHLAAGGLSEQSVNLRKAHLRRAERILGHDLDIATQEELEKLVARSGKSREYKRSIKTSLSVYFSYLQARGARTDNPVGLMQKIKPMPPHPHPASDIAYYGAKLSADSAELLMLRFAAECGLRRGEVAQIHERDFFRDLMGMSLTVHGKGGKLRDVPIEDDLARAALRKIKSHGGGYLFPGADHGHLSAHWIGKRISRLLPAGVTMHALRHRFATRVYSRTHDILATQQLLGHASPATTQLYVAVDSARLREVASRAAA